MGSKRNLSSVQLLPVRMLNGGGHGVQCGTDLHDLAIHRQIAALSHLCRMDSTGQKRTSRNYNGLWCNKKEGCATRKRPRKGPKSLTNNGAQGRN